MAAEPSQPDLLNDVAMQGKGAYNVHSELQREAVFKALPLLEKAARETERLRSQNQDANKPLTIAEYGSAQGNNSIQPLQIITQSLSSSQLQIFLNDRPSNDFTVLSTTITEWSHALDQATNSPPSLFVGMVPGNFYRQVLPAQSVDLAFCFNSLHHLERTPRTTGEDLQPVPNAKEILAAQSHRDLCTFLRHREAEMVPGSSMVLCFPATSRSGRENVAGPVTSFWTAAKEMVEEGKLAAEIAAGFQSPTHQRTMEEIHRSLDTAGDGWVVRELFEDWLDHPAIEELNRDKARNGESEAASVKYADTVIDWLFAIFAGYLLKAAKHADPSCTDEMACELLAEWTRRTKAVFLRDHRDEEVSFSFAYIWLQRSSP